VKTLVQRFRPLAAASIAAFALTAAVSAPQPVAAAGGGHLSLAITGTAVLPVFPCGPVTTPQATPASVGDGNPAYCTGGAFAGTATGVITDTDGTTITCSPVNPCIVTASFNYDEPCPAPVPTPPAVGFAYGDITVAGFTADFSWVRNGTNANLLLRVDDDAVNTDPPETGSDGSAAATFVPTNPVPPGTCAAPAAPQQATVAGSGTATWVS